MPKTEEPGNENPRFRAFSRALNKQRKENLIALANLIDTEKSRLGNRTDFMQALAAAVECGLTQQQIAEVCGASLATASRWVTGTNSPARYVRIPIAEEVRKILIEEAKRL